LVKSLPNTVILKTIAFKYQNIAIILSELEVLMAIEIFSKDGKDF
jgi:hypothetical protein